MITITLYEILDVEETASESVIKVAFRRQATTLHPDMDRGNAALFRQVVEAKETLLDPERRREYDAFLARTRGGGRAEGTSAPSNPPPPEPPPYESRQESSSARSERARSSTPPPPRSAPSPPPRSARTKRPKGPKQRGRRDLWFAGLRYRREYGFHLQSPERWISVIRDGPLFGLRPLLHGRVGQRIVGFLMVFCWLSLIYCAAAHNHSGGTILIILLLIRRFAIHEWGPPRRRYRVF